MDEYNKYDALARTTNMEDIASCEHNREIFRRLKEMIRNLFACGYTIIQMRTTHMISLLATGRSWDGWDILWGETQLYKD